MPSYHGFGIFSWQVCYSGWGKVEVSGLERLQYNGVRDIGCRCNPIPLDSHFSTHYSEVGIVESLITQGYVEGSTRKEKWQSQNRLDLQPSLNSSEELPKMLASCMTSNRPNQIGHCNLNIGVLLLAVNFQSPHLAPSTRRHLNHTNLKSTRGIEL